MKQIYEATNMIEAQILKDYLANSHIDVIIRGEFLQGALGELPVNTYPTLWVLDDKEETNAIAAINAFQASNENSHWICPNCQELVDAPFTQCWNCQQDKPGQLD
ncbi:MAG: DUF2007 domain-containing protein [Gammaproteobacteria bacterium]|nr:DUF2007 domain-containing protein [Gammaproteobacteria bacterium]